jgi:trimethylamine--corrinoid protein Co-methyltransferase
MPTPRIQLLTQSQKVLIHERSLHILQQVGLRFNSQQALKILADAGCEVDREKGSAKIGRHAVEQALETLPSQFLLAARDPRHNIQCGGGEMYYTAAAQSPSFRDLDTRKRRPATTADLVQCAHLVNALDLIHEWAAMVVPHDVPPVLSGLQALRVSLSHNTKHFLGGAREAELLPFVMECFDALLGHRDRLREQPIFSAVINPVSPLGNEGSLVDATLSFAPYQVPIFLQFLPLAGATSPASLAGTVLQENAEFLGNMTLFQLASPGWPIIWASAAGVLDMRSGRWSEGPEHSIMQVALIEMARFYGVPSNAFGIASAIDAKAIGFQSGMETMMAGLVAGLAGVDNMWGPADLDGSSLVDLPFILLVNEGVRQLNRLLEGMRVDGEHLLLKAIMEMRFRGDYLAHPSTKRFFRKEHLLPDLLPRESYEAWGARGQTEEELAISRVREILEAFEPTPLPPEVEKEMDRVMEAAYRQLVDK